MTTPLVYNILDKKQGEAGKTLHKLQPLFALRQFVGYIGFMDETQTTRKVGRPAEPEEDRNSVAVMVHISPKLSELMDAQRGHETRSSWVRRVLEARLQTPGNTPATKRAG